MPATADGLKADVWSLGVITYVLLCGEPLFAGSPDEIAADIRKVASDIGSRLEGDGWGGVSTSAKHLLHSMLSPEPERPSAAALLRHPWINSRRAVDVLCRTPPQQRSEPELEVLLRMLETAGVAELWDDDGPALRALCQLAEYAQLSRGEALWGRGAAADAVYLVLQGRVTVVDGGRSHDRCAGEFLGQEGLVDGDLRRQSEAHAHEESHLLRLPVAELRRLGSGDGVALDLEPFSRSGQRSNLVRRKHALLLAFG